MRIRRTPAFATLLAILTAVGSCAAAAAIDVDQAMRLSQEAVGRTIGPYRFTDAAGRPFALTQLRGRPFVVNFVYTSCAFVCPTLTAQVATAVDVARDVLGPDDFAVVTIGFDTAVDTPKQMARYAAERGIAMPLWHFLSGDARAIGQLAAETGFSFAPLSGGFDHLAQITIVDGTGRIYRQVYGPDIEPPMIVDPLKRLVLRIETPAQPVSEFLDKVRLLCTSYDPKTGRYRFDYSLILEIFIGVTCAIGIGVFVFRAWRDGGPTATWRS